MDFFSTETWSTNSNWYFSEPGTILYMSKRLKNSVKIPKYEEMTQKLKNSKTDILEQFFKVRYAVSINFIGILKETCILY